MGARSGEQRQLQLASQVACATTRLVNESDACFWEITGGLAHVLVLLQGAQRERPKQLLRRGAANEVGA
jgi:hypothetical protein